MAGRAKLRILVAVTAWWLSWGLLNATNYRQMTVAGGNPAAWAHVLATELASSLLWVPFTLLALWLAERWPLGRLTARSVGAHLGGVAATIFGRAAVVALFNDQIHWYADAVPPFDELLMISVYNNLFFYLLITVGAHALHYARAHREREAQLARAELHALRAQIQPHFLFNTLNTIASLVHDEPRTAERMITGLGTLLRRSLDSDGSYELPLRDELAVLRAYLEIEQVRFADRLTVVWDIRPDTLAAAVPPLLLQPLAENAIRHGLWPRPAAGQLLIRAERRGDFLRLVVSDNGVGLRRARPDDGIGLANTRARLRQLYGIAHDFQLAERIDGGVVATILLPYRVLSEKDNAAGPTEARDDDSYVAGR